MDEMKTVLIVGGSGFVGTRLALGLRERYRVYATHHRHPVVIPGVSPVPLEIHNRTWCKSLVYAIEPDVIVYAAGRSSIEWAERNATDTESLHTQGPGMVSSVSELFQPRFVYLSSAHVFDGKRGNYREGDTVLPDSNLGKAKVAGENFVRGKSLNWTIIRSSPVYGCGSAWNHSFLDALRARLSRGERVELPGTELHSFAPVSGLVQTVVRAIEGAAKNKVFHFGGLNKLTYLELGRRFARRHGFDERLVTGQESDEPLDLSLNSSQAIRSLKIDPLLLEEGLDLLDQDLVAAL